MTQAPAKYHRLTRRYARYAPNYDQRWRDYSDASLGEAAKLLAPFLTGADSLLDVACGTGLLTERIRPDFPALSITGVDVSNEMLEQARERTKGDPLVNWKQGRAESLPFHSGEFDIVTCTNAFHLVQDQSAGLQEFNRVLKPGGILVIVDWRPDRPTMRLLQWWLNVLDPGGRNILMPKELAALTGQAGFTVEHIERFHPSWFWGLVGLVARKVTDGVHNPQ